MRLDTSLQVRLRRTDIATAFLALQSQGRYPASMSQIVRDIFEAGVYSLVQGGAREITNVDEATTLLKARFGSRGNPRGRGLKNLALNLMDYEATQDSSYEQQLANASAGARRALERGLGSSDLVKQREEKDRAQLDAQKAILDNMGLIKEKKGEGDV